MFPLFLSTQIIIPAIAKIATPPTAPPTIAPIGVEFESESEDEEPDVLELAGGEVTGGGVVLEEEVVEAGVRVRGLRPAAFRSDHEEHKSELNIHTRSRAFLEQDL